LGAKSSVSPDQGEVGFQLGFLLDDVFVDRFAADFFFALENNFHIDGQLAATGLHERFEGFHFHPELAFVVNGAAGVDVVVRARWARRAGCATRRAVRAGWTS